MKYKDLELPGEEVAQEKGILDSLMFWDDGESNDKAKDSEGKKEKLSVPSPGAVLNKADDSARKPYSETDFSLFDLWGSEDDNPGNENRYRVKIVDMDGMAKVYLEHPDGSYNNSKQGQQVLRIIYEQVK